jgi:hypothetical protein
MLLLGQLREERAESCGVVTAWGVRREGKGGRQFFMVCLVTARYCNSHVRFTPESEHC